MGGVVVPGVGTEVGLPLLGAETAREALVLAGAAVGQVAALGDEGSVLVAVDGDLQFLTEALAQLVGILDHLFHGDVAHGNQGANVGGTLTGVGTVVLGHVDKLSGLLNHLISSLKHRLGFTYEGDDSTIGSLTRVDVKEFHTFHLLNLGSHLIDDIHVAPFADIGHAFNKLLHFFIFYILCKYTNNILFAEKYLSTNLWIQARIMSWRRGVKLLLCTYQNPTNS